MFINTYTNQIKCHFQYLTNYHSKMNNLFLPNYYNAIGVSNFRIYIVYFIILEIS